MAVVPRRSSVPRSERHMFSSSDDNSMTKQIQATHAPDGREFAVKPLLLIVEDIFHRAAPSITGIVEHQGDHQKQSDALDEKAVENGLNEMLELLAFTINKVSCEITCKSLSGADAHATTMAVFNMLSNYTWDAKVVLALAAFAVNYGEFCLVAQLYLTDPLAKAVGLLKQLPDILGRTDSLKTKFEALSVLIRAMMDVAKCIVHFKELPSQYITPDTPAIVTATAHIPTAAYWTVRSIVACATQIVGLIGMAHEYIASTTEAWELSSLAHKVSNIHSHLLKQLTICYQQIDEKRQFEAFQALVHLFETVHMDNMKILRALIYANDDQLPLFDGSSKKRVSLDLLRRNNVLLLISDLDLSLEEISTLNTMYNDKKQHPGMRESQYEIVWLPVVDRSIPWNDAMQKKFESLQSMMTWFSVYHPSLLDPTVIRYIKEVWHFNKKPLIVVLDPQGKVTNLNAIHMMWIWRGSAYPFTSQREEDLWNKESWRIVLLVDDIHPSILTWIKQEKFVCLYGGEDMQWIGSFTERAKHVATVADIQLEMLYVGKSNLKERIRKNNAIIQGQNLSHVLTDLSWMWYFWARLESMWHSKVQHNRSVEDDQIMQEIVTILSYDGSDEGWAVISRGTAEMTKAKGDLMLKSFEDFEFWYDDVARDKGFVRALSDRLRDLHTPLHCNRLILPGTTDSIPERVVCAECGRPMDKFIMYRCCID